MPQNGFDYLPPQQQLMALKLAIAEAAVKMKSKMDGRRRGKANRLGADVLRDGGKRKAGGGRFLSSTSQMSYDVS